MEANFWHERWAKREIGFHLDDVNPFLIKHWPAAQAGSSDTVFVPLCGKTKDLIWLADQVKSVIGIELSQTAIEEFFHDNELVPNITEIEDFTVYQCENITLLCGDFFNLTQQILADCQFVYDRASLVALPPEMRKAYVKKLHEIMSDEASRLLITFEYPQHEMAGPPHSVSASEVQILLSDQFNIECLESKNIIANAQRFKDKGVTKLFEHVFLLKQKLS